MLRGEHAFKSRVAEPPKFESGNRADRGLALWQGFLVAAVFYVLAAVVGLLGLAFVVGHQGMPMRIVVGVILLVVSGALVLAARLRPKVEQRNIVKRVDVSGDVKAAELTCQRCGASLGPSDVKVEGGVAVVSCKFCDTTYQLQEEIKW
jgi:hypothetical protein